MNRRGDLPSDDFGPLLPGPAFGGLAHVTKVLFSLGCFQQEELCPKCNHSCKLKTDLRSRKLKDGREKEYTEMSFRCTHRKCQARVHFIDRTIWAIIKDRILFVFVVNAFLNRSSTQSIVNDTGCKAETAEKYLKIIKNSLFLEMKLKSEKCFLAGMGRRSRSTNHASFQESMVLVGCWKQRGMAGCLASLKINPTAASTFKWCETKTRQRSNRSSRTTFAKGRQSTQTVGLLTTVWRR